MPSQFIKEPVNTQDALPTDLEPNNRWLDVRHPHWEANVDIWHYIDIHYTGEALQIARQRAADLADIQGPNLTDRNSFDYAKHPILWRRTATESPAQFKERVFVSRYPRVMAAVVDEFSGSLGAVEAKDQRIYSDSWNGKPDDPESLLYNFWKNADGAGNNFLSLIRAQYGRMTRFHRVWYIVETDTIAFPNIWDVVNWRFEGTRLVDVVIREGADTRKSIKERPGAMERYVHYHIDGWDRYELDTTAKVRTFVHLPDQSGLWKFKHYETSDRVPGEEILPVGYVDMELDGFPGRDMAEGANYLYNLLSDARIILRSSNYPLWIGDVTDNLFQVTVENRGKGWNFLQGDWKNEGPSAENAQVAFDKYKEEAEDFRKTVHQMLEATTQSMTATEVVTQDNRGRRSFLTAQASGMETLERRIWFLKSQKQFPNNPDMWDETTVNRTRDFAVIDSVEWATRLTERYFGNNAVIPVGEKGKLDAAKKIATLDGVEFDPDELEAAVKSQDTAEQAGNERIGLENERLRLINANEAGQGDLNQRIDAISGNGS